MIYNHHRRRRCCCCRRQKIGFGGIMIGGQMDEEQTHTVLNHAFDKAGINWLDTSESYP